MKQSIICMFFEVFSRKLLKLHENEAFFETETRCRGMGIDLIFWYDGNDWF